MRDGEMTTGTEPSELDRLKQELDNEHQMYLRSLADFDNYRRRVERERASTTIENKRGIILSLIDILDSFDRALPHLTDAPSSQGVRAIHRQLVGLLESHGVTPFDSIGEAFNPELHEAIGSAHSDHHQPGTVAEEVRRGYRWSEGLLRPARVRVAE
jgi:molecular chaperone GrpE